MLDIITDFANKGIRQADRIIDELDELKKVSRCKRANWIGFWYNEGTLWVNFLEGKQELERYNDE